jgi:pantetheine-phosphate adenylyltransferase
MKKNMAVYPGTFDPITNGHLDIIERASDLFDKVIVTIALNTNKKPLFTKQERMDMIRKVTGNFKNIEVDSFDGLLVDYAARKNASVIIRGLRAVSDFEYEFQMSLTNRKLAPNITTIFLMPN